MYNYYKGHSGRVRKVQDSGKKSAGHSYSDKKTEYSRNSPEYSPRTSGADHRKSSGIMEQFGSFLPKTLGELDIEEIILLLILYLLYRDSGDSELLIIMGAMLFL